MGAINTHGTFRFERNLASFSQNLTTSINSFPMLIILTKSLHDKTKSIYPPSPVLCRHAHLSFRPVYVRI